MSGLLTAKRVSWIVESTRNRHVLDKVFGMTTRYPFLSNAQPRKLLRKCKLIWPTELSGNPCRKCCSLTVEPNFLLSQIKLCCFKIFVKPFFSLLCSYQPKAPLSEEIEATPEESLWQTQQAHSNQSFPLANSLLFLAISFTFQRKKFLLFPSKQTVITSTKTPTPKKEAKKKND